MTVSTVTISVFPFYGKNERGGRNISWYLGDALLNKRNKCVSGCWEENTRDTNYCRPTSRPLSGPGSSDFLLIKFRLVTVMSIKSQTTSCCNFPTLIPTEGLAAGRQPCRSQELIAHQTMGESSWNRRKQQLQIPFNCDLLKKDYRTSPSLLCLPTSEGNEMTGMASGHARTKGVVDRRETKIQTDMYQETYRYKGNNKQIQI